MMVKTDQDDMVRRMLGHQVFDFCEDLGRCYLVLVRKTGVDLYVTRDVGKKCGVECRGYGVQIGKVGLSTSW
jgi:hypothetical protein